MSGNPWIAQQREAAFRAELNDKSIWINVAAMLLSEGSPLQSCESLFNRVMYVRSSAAADDHADDRERVLWSVRSR